MKTPKFKFWHWLLGVVGAVIAGVAVATFRHYMGW